MDIMIVDDDEDDISLFCEAVEDINPSLVCATARNGLEALANLETYPRLPKCIFLDVNMPLMDGRQTLIAMRENPKYASIKIVMYSTTQDRKEIKNYTDRGIEFIIKPNTYDEIVHTIRNYLDAV